MDNKFKAFFKSFSDSEEHFDFKMANESLNESVDVISTGSMVFDDALICGGLPRGRVIQFYGKAGSGKSLASMLAIKQAQMADPMANQVFIDAEQTFDANWASQLGCDPSKIMVIDGDMASYAKECFEILLGTPKEDAKHQYAGKSKEGLLDKITKKEFNINMIILDSLGALITPIESVAQTGAHTMSPLARFLSANCKKLSVEVTKAKVVFIVINHNKDDMNMYSTTGGHTYSGGNVWRHTLSQNVYFEAVQRKDAAILDENERKIGNTLRITVEKNKLGPWPRKCETQIDFTKGYVDLHAEIAKLALEHNIVQKTSSVSYEYGDYKWRGEANYIAGVAESQELQDELMEKILEKRNASKAISHPFPVVDVDAEEEPVEKKRRKKASDEAAAE